MVWDSRPYKSFPKEPLDTEVDLERSSHTKINHLSSFIL